MIWDVGFDPKFQALIWLDEKMYGTVFDGTSYLNTWPNPKVEVMPGHVFEKKGDFFSLSFYLVASQDAFEVIKDLIEDSVELLPITWLTRPNEIFYFLNVIDVVDCLNKELSIFDYFLDGGVMSVDHYEFIEEKIINKHIFRILETKLSRFYVSDEFKKRVESSKLRGLTFDPLP